MKENKRFLRNILVGIIALILVAVIVNIAPGYKREQYANVTNLVISDENVTEKLINKICFDDKQNIYISIDDLKNLFDSTVYYDESTEQVIMTSNTRTASMKLNENKIKLNGVELDTLAPLIKIENIIYIPIQELENVYNIEINYINNKVIVDLLSKSMISADVTTDTVLRYKARTLSKEVTTLTKGQNVYCFYTSSRGWRLIRTMDGNVGYIKANNLTNEYVLRQDMDTKNDAETIKISLNDGTVIDINNKKIIIRDIPNLTSTTLQTNEYNVWLNVKNDLSEEEMNKIFENYEQRNAAIENIVNYAVKSEVKAINVDMSEINTNESFTRFLLELSPRLRDVGILTNVVKTNNLQEDLLKERIDYFIEKQ